MSWLLVDDYISDGMPHGSNDLGISGSPQMEQNKKTSLS